MPETGTVVVTGAAGFFGLAIVRALTRAGVTVIATDRVDERAFIPRAGTQTALVCYVRCDLATDPLEALVAKAGGVVHAAALTPLDEHDPGTAAALLRVNLAAFLRLLPAMRTGGSCTRLLFVSSAAVYDQGSPRRLDEASADGGSSLYGAAKLAAELVGRRYADLAGWDFCAVRPTSLYGDGEIARTSRPRVTAFAQLVAAARHDVAVRLERTSSRADWLCVDDAADAIALLWRSPQLDGGSYNLSTGVPRPFAQVAEAVAAAGLRVAETATSVIDGGPDRPAVIASDRLQDLLGWQPTRTLDAVARELVSQPALPTESRR